MERFVDGDALNHALPRRIESAASSQLRRKSKNAGTIRESAWKCEQKRNILGRFITKSRQRSEVPSVRFKQGGRLDLNTQRESLPHRISVKGSTVDHPE